MMFRSILVGAVAGLALVAAPLAASAMPFTTMGAGFTAEVVAMFPTFLGGVAFANDGDILSNGCGATGGQLYRWNVQGGKSVVGGSTIFSDVVAQESNTGCGMISHSDGHIYTNTIGGVVRLNGDGSQVGVAAGDSGNALGLSEDPLTGLIYWVGADETIMAIDPGTDQIVVDAFANNGGQTDGIYWHPTGDYLFATRRNDAGHAIDVFDRDGGLVIAIDMVSEPDDISFAIDGSVFTNNTDGTLSRIIFDSLDDLTVGHAVNLFASGGFRGDLSHVGSDGCWYITQQGTRFADDSTSPENSIVKVCDDDGGGFFVPPGLRRPNGQIPEPMSLSLLGLGMLGFAVAFRRRSAA